MTEKKLAANRRNAQLSIGKSTGPKTPEGKRRSSINALKHGLRAFSLAVPLFENAKDWKVHLALTVRNLEPQGYVEMQLAIRVAYLLWRLGRVARYESEVISIAMQEAQEATDDDSDEEDGKTLHELEEDMRDAEKTTETLARVHTLKPSAKISGEDAHTVHDVVATSLGLDLAELGLNIPGLAQDIDWEPTTGGHGR